MREAALFRLVARAHRLRRRGNRLARLGGEATSAGLLDWLRSRGGRYAEALRDLSVVRVAVNQKYVGLDHPVRDGDEVAISRR